MPRGVHGVIELADDLVSPIDRLQGLQTIQVIVHIPGASAIGITHTLAIPHIIISVGGLLTVVIGDGVQAIEVIKRVFGDGGIGAAAAGIGDIRLQQGAVTGFVVIVGDHRAIGLGFGEQTIQIIVSVRCRTSRIGGRFALAGERVGVTFRVRLVKNVLREKYAIFIVFCYSEGCVTVTL